MRTSTRAAAASLALAAAIVATALPAQAMRPSTADLVDAAGDENGCTVTVAITKAILASSIDLGPGIFANTVVVCPGRADIHRLGFNQDFFEILPDGTHREIGKGRTGGTSQVGDPIVDPVSSGQFTPCSSPANSGEHKYFVRARVAAKVEPTYVDPNPYIGKVAAKAVITC
jgi:hypothetical protein